MHNNNTCTCPPRKKSASALLHSRLRPSSRQQTSVLGSIHIFNPTDQNIFGRSIRDHKCFVSCCLVSVFVSVRPRLVLSPPTGLAAPSTIAHFRLEFVLIQYPKTNSVSRVGKRTSRLRFNQPANPTSKGTKRIRQHNNGGRVSAVADVGQVLSS